VGTPHRKANKGALKLETPFFLYIWGVLKFEKKVEKI